MDLSDEIKVYDRVELEFDLRGDGWADLRFRVGESTLVIEWFSDLANSLHDFAFAAIGAASGGGRQYSRFSLDGEPREWRWTIMNRFRQGFGYYAHIQVEEFEDGNPMMFAQDGRIVPRRPEPKGQILFDAYCPSDSFAHAVLKAFDPLNEMGAAEVEERWQMAPYPTRTLAALDAALKTPRRWNDPNSNSRVITGANGSS
jgi:hypothetical protein